MHDYEAGIAYTYSYGLSKISNGEKIVSDFTTVRLHNTK